MVEKNRIRGLVERIVQEFQPDKIILFGSYARGNPTSDSDVDLLVILPHEGKSWRMAAKIRGQLQPEFPLDLLVRTPDEMQRRIAGDAPFLQDIERTGEVLYERHRA